MLIKYFANFEFCGSLSLGTGVGVDGSVDFVDGSRVRAISPEMRIDNAGVAVAFFSECIGGSPNCLKDELTLAANRTRTMVTTMLAINAYFGFRVDCFIAER